MSEKDKNSTTGKRDAPEDQGGIRVSSSWLHTVLHMRGRGDKTLRQLLPPDDGGEVLLENDVDLLLVYDYFQQNFAITKDSIPQDLRQQFEYVVKNISSVAKDDKMPSSLMQADYDLGPDKLRQMEMIKALQGARGSGKIPPAAYNAIFLFRDKTLATALLRASIKNYLFKRKFVLSNNEIGLVIDSIFRAIKQSPTSAFSIDKFAYLVNIEIVYGYFQSNFCLDRESIPKDIRQQFEYVAKNIALVTSSGNGTSSLMHADYDLEASAEGKQDMAEALQGARSSGKIPPAAYNAIFLFKDSTLATRLLTFAIRNHMSARKDLGAGQADEQARDRVIQDIVRNIFDEIRKSPSSEFNLSHYLSVSIPMCSYASKVRSRIDMALLCDAKREHRKQAVSQIESDYAFVKKWQPNPISLSDSDMARYFKRKNRRDDEDDNSEFLTTYFDSASIGLSFDKLGEIIGKLSADLSFPRALVKYKPLILRSLGRRYSNNFAIKDTVTYQNGGHDIEASVPKNVFVTRNGTEAAMTLLQSCIKDDVEVELVVANQEYGPIVDNLPRAGKRINITVLPPYEQFKDDESYMAAVRELLGGGFGGFRYFLVSDVSRLGSNFPLKLFAELRDEINGSKTRGRARLIVDASQAVGRKSMDYDDVCPDAVFGSCQKASITASEAEAVGFFVISDDFYMSDQCDKDSLAKSEGGTDPQRPFIHAGVACAPDSLNEFREMDEYRDIIPDSRIFERISASMPTREKAVTSLSRKFAELVREINKKNGNKIRILNPRSESIYLDSEEIDESRLSGVFECKIDGVGIDRIKQVSGREYGITIGDPRLPNSPEEIIIGGKKVPDDGNDSSEGPTTIIYDHPEMMYVVKDQTEKDSFRIAIHPYMGNNAIKMLGFVLMELCQEVQQ